MAVSNKVHAVFIRSLRTKLRGYFEASPREPMPQRFVVLIHFLPADPLMAMLERPAAFAVGFVRCNEFKKDRGAA
jgi:hypothetical protein